MDKTKLPHASIAFLLPLYLLAGCAGSADINPSEREAACARSCSDAYAQCTGTSKHVDIVAICREKMQACLSACPAAR